MGASIRMEVSVLDAATSTRMNKYVEEIGLRNGGADLEHLFDETDDRCLTPEDVAELRDETADPDARDALDRLYAALSDPAALIWPGGYEPNDRFPLAELSLML